jgi:formylglycine-generating enzyme required for sulfatase activity
MKLLKLCLINVLLLLFYIEALPNNLHIENVIRTAQNIYDNNIMIDFDVSWENSWRTENLNNDGVNNWDAIWVFVKYQKENDGKWYHASLSTEQSNFSSGEGTEMSVEPRSDGKGVFIYIKNNGSGTVETTNIQVCWEYGRDGISDNIDGNISEIRVFGIEMVYIPEGNFYVGDGSSIGSYRQVSSNTPVQITSEPIILRCNNTDNDDEQLENDGILVDGDNGIDKDGNEAVDNPYYPTGYKSIYCMKYEITQEQYVAFLNTLTRDQQNTRTGTDISGTNIINRYVMSNTEEIMYRNGIRCNETLENTTEPVNFYCDLNGNGIGNENNDGQNIACDYISWGDGCEYSDWAGLRPMSSLEFEKICRGPLEPVADEKAWGTEDVNEEAYFLENMGTSEEGIENNYSLTEGNCIHGGSTSQIRGPYKVGIFAGNTNNTGRKSSGATYYGVMEMSGNVYERLVSMGNITGRSFTGANGDGNISNDGDANVGDWPNENAEGSGFRGGFHTGISSHTRVSNRGSDAEASTLRFYTMGFRCVTSE